MVSLKGLHAQTAASSTCPISSDARLTEIAPTGAVAVGSNALQPNYDVDLYSDAVIVDPYPHYRALRDHGGAVFLPRNRLWAISRYADVREALRNPTLFSSAHGVAANEATNAISTGNLLASDPPTHTTLRKVVAAPLLAPAMNDIKDRIETAAETLVARLVAQGSFDAVTDFAQVLPLAIVSDLVGLPEEGRQNMLRWASATFDMLGGDNARAADALPVVREMREYTVKQATPERLKPNSWAARLYEASDKGIVPHALCPTLMRDYLGPSLDTTIFATGHMMLLFGRHPEQWERLCAEPSLIANAINETIRLESPIRGFTRYLTADHEIDGVTLKAGSRALLLFASANRDERKWQEPERFDITRIANDHLGFGHGIHACAGMQLARLEMRSLLMSLVKRVKRFEIGKPVLAINNTLRGLESLPVRVITN